MGISNETVWDENKELIIRMDELVRGGMKERAALLEVLPEDVNRSRKLGVWKKRGLWPLSKAKEQGLWSGEVTGGEASAEAEPEGAGTEDMSERSDTGSSSDHLPDTERLAEVEPTADAEQETESERELLGIPRDWVEEMKQIAREVAKEVMLSAPSGAVVTGDQGPKELAPEPVRVDGTKVKGEKGFGAMRFEGSRFKLASTVDGTLYKLVKEERRKRGVPLSRMLDTIIWHYFGKPKLSFESPESESEPSETE